MELKHYLHDSIVLVGLAFNRTTMELKLLIWGLDYVRNFSFNRTTMELKQLADSSCPTP